MVVEKKEETKKEVKPEPVIKKCPEKKPLYNPVTNRCILNTKQNLKKLGLEFKQKTQEIKESKSFKIMSAKANLKKNEVDLLNNFDTVLDNMWKATMYKILVSMQYVLNRHKNAHFVSGTINTPQRRIIYEKFHIMYIVNRYIRTDPYLTKIVYKQEDKNKQRIRRNRQEHQYMTVPINLNLYEQIQNCKRNNKRFLIGLIYLSNKLVGGAHENSYIYDIQKQELEIFEPNGASAYDILNKYKSKKMYNAVVDYFKSQNIPVKKLYKPMDYCMKGPQIFDYYTMRKLKNPPGGYCAAWSIYYLDARLSNPDIPRNVLIRIMEDSFRNDSALFINTYTHYIFTNFLMNVLNIDKIRREYPNFIENFKKDKLSIEERQYLNDELIYEITKLVSSM